MDKAAAKAIEFLGNHDSDLQGATGVSVQPNSSGRSGDVRDVLIHTRTGDVGISAKNRHHDIKHSRLSATIDFGNEWYGKPCSPAYWRAVKPVFQQLRVLEAQGELWRNLPNKSQDFYAPVMKAFEQEIKSANPPKLTSYLLGIHDYYKVIKENGDVVLQAFKLHGSLKWGKKLPMPTRVVQVNHLRASTVEVLMDSGWQLKFRLHNAKTKVEPSMKLSISFIGTPRQTMHTIKY